MTTSTVAILELCEALLDEEKTDLVEGVIFHTGLSFGLTLSLSNEDATPTLTEVDVLVGDEWLGIAYNVGQILDLIDEHALKEVF
jgi:hypothetical protein